MSHATRARTRSSCESNQCVCADETHKQGTSTCTVFILGLSSRLFTSATSTVADTLHRSPTCQNLTDLPIPQPRGGHTNTVELNAPSWTDVHKCSTHAMLYAIRDGRYDRSAYDVLSMHILSASHAVAQSPIPISPGYSSDGNLRGWKAFNLSLYPVVSCTPLDGFVQHMHTSLCSHTCEQMVGELLGSTMEVA